MNAHLNPRDETIATLAREGLTNNEIAELLRRAQSAQNFAVLGCNRPVTGREQKRADANEEKIRALVRYKGRGWGVEIGGDPRGYVVKVKLPSGASNHWGGETWGIFAR